MQCHTYYTFSQNSYLTWQYAKKNFVFQQLRYYNSDSDCRSMHNSENETNHILMRWADKFSKNIIYHPHGFQYLHFSLTIATMHFLQWKVLKGLAHTIEYTTNNVKYSRVYQVWSEYFYQIYSFLSWVQSFCWPE